MYVKIFTQIYDSSIADDYLTRFVFEDFLILADKEGHVDMTVAAIARRTNVPIEIVNRAIEKLSSPDLESRSPDEDGRRIVLLDPYRSWGWRIVNYDDYRNIRDDEARKEYFRDQKRNQRAKSKNVQDSQGQSSNVTKAEAEAISNKDSSPATPAIEEPSLSESKAPRKPKVAASVLQEIYDAYPRHVGKNDALKAIEKAICRIAPSKDAQWLLERTRAYARQRKGEDEKYTPYPATWFNHGHYDDENLQLKPKSLQPGQKTPYELDVEKQLEERRRSVAELEANGRVA
jgi:hypothetical protein